MRPANRDVILRARQRRRPQGKAWLPLFLAIGGLLGGLCLVVLTVLTAASRAAQPTLQDARPPLVLLLGIDRRADETGPTRSDAMLLAGFNQSAGRAGLLSIPRDLWVAIPGVGDQRINTALFFGHDEANPTAGPQLAMRTVAQQFGLPITRYVLLDFQTFVRLVDALGGIEVDVPQPITDTQYPTADYGVTTIHFDAGPQTLDGEAALIYVRTRHDDSDFGRAQRQQQVIQAIVAKAAEPATWPRLPQVLVVLRTGIQTNLTAADLLGLGPLAQAALAGNVRSATLDEEHTTPWITPGGAWVLLPNWPAIDATVEDLFGPG